MAISDELRRKRQTRRVVKRAAPVPILDNFCLDIKSTEPFDMKKKDAMRGFGPYL